MGLCLGTQLGLYFGNVDRYTQTNDSPQMGAMNYKPSKIGGLLLGLRGFTTLLTHLVLEFRPKMFRLDGA